MKEDGTQCYPLSFLEQLTIFYLGFNTNYHELTMNGWRGFDVSQKTRIILSTLNFKLSITNKL